MRFSTIGAVKAGWIIKDGTNGIITDAGLEALTKYPSVELIQKNVQKLYRKWAHDNCNPKEENDLSEDDEISKNVSITYDEAQEQAQESIDAFLHQMNPYDFQDLIA